MKSNTSGLQNPNGNKIKKACVKKYNHNLNIRIIQLDANNSADVKC